MKKTNSPQKNFIYNITYQILVMIIPLITAPYLSRIVGPKGVGVYSYNYSIVYYFMLITLLGVNNYGNRTIAKVRDDKNKLSYNFWSIYLFQLMMGLIMVILYLGYIYIFDINYKNIALIDTLFIISSILDINWFFFGLEEFKKTITRNIFVKTGTIILIFIFVKTQNDLWKYTIIMSGMTCLSQLILWGFLKDKINMTKISIKDIIQHIKPNFILFIPIIAISLYKMMDKIMLGIIANVEEVAYYENAEKIHNIPMSLIMALGTVMLPRMSNILSKGKKKLANEYIRKSMKFVMFMSFAMCVGLIVVGEKFAPVYFGEKFSKSGILIILLAITIPFSAIANVLRTQYIIPNEKDKIYICSVFVAAFFNLILNAIFIPRLYSVGACIGTISAEALVMIFQSYLIRKDIEIKEYVRFGRIFLYKSLIMLVLLYPLNFINMNDYIRLTIQITSGCILYFMLNFKYIMNELKVGNLIKKILRK